MKNIKLTPVEWADIALNPIKGKCPISCSYCYAEKQRVKFGNPDGVALHLSVIQNMLKLKESYTIYWGSNFEIFADSVPDEWILKIFNACVESNKYKEPDKKHNHIFLTKCPERLSRFAHFKRGGNIYFGVSTTGSIIPKEGTQDDRFRFLAAVNNCDFINIEPFIELPHNLESETDIYRSLPFTHIIIGGLTGEWSTYSRTLYSSVVSISEVALKANKSIFVKNNIKGYIPYGLCYQLNLPPQFNFFRQLPWGLYTKKKSGKREVL
jgi:protein gp37